MVYLAWSSTNTGLKEFSIYLSCSNKHSDSDRTMSEDEDMNEYPDFVQIGKSSPSHESLPSRENSVILEARDLKQSVGKLFI